MWFVDSESTDESTILAAQAGAQVLRAPLGKGRAMTAALEGWRDGWLIFVDADIQDSERSIPGALRDAARTSTAGMIVGEVGQPGKRRSVTPYLYRPLVGALFPETPPLDRPLSGFRALRSGLELGELPPGYGAEVHLNVEVAITGEKIETLALGTLRGPVRDYANIPRLARDIATALLDCGQAHGRIADRGPWDDWTERVLAVIDEQPGDGEADEAYLHALRTAAAAPLPVGPM